MRSPTAIMLSYSTILTLPNKSLDEQKRPSRRAVPNVSGAFGLPRYPPVEPLVDWSKETGNIRAFRITVL